eukprot:TRINITY_DN3400_c0_g1_i1.p1 TRINITY_DN3400_c0_g1~~TRINITY_DN3400_c0_g1_i1.p1  ORF type:complete len:452 (+),score=104.65 TRINITY_DN3400_c0_g1_i1:24-1358(+)
MEFELRPGSIGNIRVGQSLLQSLAVLKEDYPSIASPLKCFSLKSDPLKEHIIIELPVGIELRFLADTQRLLSVAVSVRGGVALVYEGRQLCGHCQHRSDNTRKNNIIIDNYNNDDDDDDDDQTKQSSVSATSATSVIRGAGFGSSSGGSVADDGSALSIPAVHRIVGAAKPGMFDSECSQYIVNYPGIAFIFDIPPSQIDNCKAMRSAASFHPSEPYVLLPHHFEDGSTPVVSKIVVFSGTSYQDASVPRTLPAIDGPLLYFEEIIANIGKGIFLTRMDKMISFKSGVQEVLSVFGTPSQVFYKKEDKLKIHSPKFSSSDQEENRSCDYFYNYFQNGIDFLFDGENHNVKKIVLHTNVPGHHEFSIYSKCNFSLFMNDKDLKLNKDSKKGQIIATFGDSTPLVNEKGKIEMPFGPTFFYGYKNIIFEFVKDNDCLASVCLFSDN